MKHPQKPWFSRGFTSIWDHVGDGADGDGINVVNSIVTVPNSKPVMASILVVAPIGGLWRWILMWQDVESFGISEHRI